VTVAFRRLARLAPVPAIGSAALLLALLILPIVALVATSTPAELMAGVRHPLFWPALSLSARTSLVSLMVIVIGGTPLAWWLATTQAPAARLVEACADLPIVIPPAVVGVALLQTFGRAGLLGPWLDGVGIHLPFTTAAVVVAQIVVSAPFYLQAAVNAFRKVDLDLLVVARTLGASPVGAILRVAVPVALPGLMGGAALSWARAIGEFGATLLFAGNLEGTTRTMPLAIFSALESDVRAAQALSVALAICAVAVLLGLRALPSLWRQRVNPAAAGPVPEAASP
jgi:molybdate transport system permease protein